jgi:hypothetical protein
MTKSPSRPLGDDVREVAWWVLVGVGSGAVAGFLVGGVGGRLAMLLLRLTSPELVVGMTSDDDFEIGVVTAKTLPFLLGMTMLGAVAGVVYVTLRTSIPRRLRLPLWVLFAASVGGATLVHRDGVDFRLLEPAALAVALFIAIPALAAVLVGFLVERFVVLEPAEHPRLLAGLTVAAVAGTFALVPAAVVGTSAVLLRRVSPVARVFGAAARIAVPVALVALTVLGMLDLVGDVSAIL